MTGVFIIRGDGTQNTKHTKNTCDDGSGEWNDVSGSQGMPRISGTHQKLETGKEVFSSGFQGERGPADILLLDFPLKLREDTSAVSSHPVVLLCYGSPRKYKLGWMDHSNSRLRIITHASAPGWGWAGIRRMSYVAQPKQQHSSS